MSRLHFFLRSRTYSGVGVFRLSQRETTPSGTLQDNRRTLLIVNAELDPVIKPELVLTQIAVQIFLVAVLIAARDLRR